MPVQGSMQSLTAVAASNSPAGTDAISNTLDDYLRSFAGILRHTQAQAATLTATASMSLAAATGEYVPVDCAASLSSAASVSHLGTVDAGIRRTLLFDGYAKLIHGANLLLPGSETIVTAAGDVAEVISDGAGAWRCLAYKDAAADPQWTGARRSVAASGYQILPGGLIVNWGVATGTIGNLSASYAKQFPTAVLVVVGCLKDKTAGASAGITLYAPQSLQTTSAAYFTPSGSDGTGTTTAYFIAIGH